MLDQDAVNIGCESDLAAHVLDVQGRQLSVKGLLDTVAVVSVIPISSWTDMGFDGSDLISIKTRMTAANQGAIYVAGRTPIISLHPGGTHIWKDSRQATDGSGTHSHVGAQPRSKKSFEPKQRERSRVAESSARWMNSITPEEAFSSGARQINARFDHRLA